jgi:serine protease AprX
MAFDRKYDPQAARQGRAMRSRPIGRWTATTTFAAAIAMVGAGIACAGPALAASAPVLGYEATDLGSLGQVTTLIDARAQWTAGNTGKGIDVAVIDTGVARVPGLTGTNVVNGPDLSFDSQSTATRYVDAFGHGTHMASIIAGRDGDGTGASAGAANTFSGVAPGARVISLKVGATDGTADVTQVIAAVNWVTQHAHDPGLNIRVLNLSYGTGSTQDYRSDPLSFAAETAWRKGILVVVAGGNDGSSRPFLANPALNPNLLSVGAEDPMGTAATADDTIPTFSQRGNDQRHVDLVAPGAHLLGLRVPGGAVDVAYPTSKVGTRFTRGSGTSQASAVVSGAAALLLAAKPSLTPDQAKWLLIKTAIKLPKTTTLTAGAGLIDVTAAVKAAATAPTTATLTATSQYGSGTGSIEATRGSGHIVLDSVELVGEKDIFGRNWNAAGWATATKAGTSWSGGSYTGSEWTGTTWAASSTDWAGRSWIGSSWTGRSWISEDWAGRSWIDSTWTGKVWMGGPWASGSWS